MSVARVDQDRFLLTGVLVSIALHLMLAALLFRRQPIPPELPIVVNVSFELPRREDRRLPRQIVSPPERAEKREPIDARLLSDRNSSVERESVRRGDAPEAGPLVGRSGPPAPAASDDSRSREGGVRAAHKAARPSEKEGAKAARAAPRVKEALALEAPKRSERLKDLSLDSSTLIAKFGDGEKKPTLDESITGQGTRSLSGYKAFSRPSGSGAAFLGVSGTNDYLPHLPDGDITLLNTKAEKFAVFVRRVATQVFSQLRLSGWETLRRSDIDSMRGFSTVVAVMGLDGSLRSVILEDPSGSQRFDAVLGDAVRKGARDNNPPKEAAASDGNIRFVFKARTWAMAGSDPRSGAPFERRWLLLATGLE